MSINTFTLFIYYLSFGFGILMISYCSYLVIAESREQVSRLRQTEAHWVSVVKEALFSMRYFALGVAIVVTAWLGVISLID